MTMTLEKRLDVMEFIYSFYRYVKDTSSLSSSMPVAKLTKIKNVLTEIKTVLLNFDALQERTMSLNNDIDYEDLFDSTVYNSMSRLSETELISKIKQLIIEEFHYETENNLLPGTESKAIFRMTDTAETARNIDRRNLICPYDNYSFTMNEVIEQGIRFSVVGHIGRQKKVRNIKIGYSGRYLDISINPTPRHYDEKKWLYNLILTTAMDYTSLAITSIFLTNKINNFIETIDGVMARINSADVDSADIEISMNSEVSSFDPNSHIRSYSHRTVTIPVMGNLMGTELEFYGDKEEIFKFKRSFERLSDLGWILENDASVTFELKSPIMELSEIQRVFNQNKMLFKAWSNLTNSEKAGLHFHIAIDDRFSIGKRPASKTKLFLLRNAQMFESTVLKDSDSRKTIFKRDYQHYCDEYGETNDYSERYRWINFQNLERDVGKTIEIRLFSSSAANELDEAAERALLIAKFFKAALNDWRAKNRPEFMTWQQSFNGQKLFKVLFSSEDLKRWRELFTNSIKNVKL